MDFSSTLKNELFRPLATIVVPGFIAALPFFGVIHFYWPSLNLLLPNCFVIYFLIVVSMGMILEDIGGRIESSVFDPIFDKLNSERNGPEIWKEYLKLKTSNEYIGQRYLRTIQLRLKFELAMIPTVVVSTIGLVWLDDKWHLFSCSSLIMIIGFLFVMWVFLIWEAYRSVALLSDLHVWIREAVRRDA